MDESRLVIKLKQQGKTTSDMSFLEHFYVGFCCVYSYQIFILPPKNNVDHVRKGNEKW